MSRAQRAILLPVLAGFGLIGCTAEDASPAGPPERSPRIVTLAPHLAELVYAAGAGEHLVGVSAYSNFPEEVSRLPQVGDAFSVDQEQLAVLRPDVLLAWDSGTPGHTVSELRNLGHRVEVLRTQRLADVAAALIAIGRLTGREEHAATVAERFRAGLEQLRQQQRGSEPIRVFYQVSLRPLYTVNAEHYVSELIELCGGQNVFADLADLAPAVSEESVLARDPELLLAGRVQPGDQPLAEWRRWPALAANRFDNRFYVHADLLARATPRLTHAGEAICARLEEGRRSRAAVASR